MPLNLGLTRLSLICLVSAALGGIMFTKRANRGAMRKSCPISAKITAIVGVLYVNPQIISF